MELLGVDDPLPERPGRVLVAGTSGAGKTTLCRQVSQILALPYTELDSLHHGPNWVPRASFADDVERLTAQPRWVCEWQYAAVRTLLAERADLLVWLDPPHRTVMRQVITRTLGRRLRREVLWNGNTEGPLHTFFTDPDHIVRWAWRHRHGTAVKVSALQEVRPELPVVRLHNRGQVRRWCGHLHRYQPDVL